MWVEKWVGKPSLRTIRSWERIRSSIIWPLLFVEGEPHRGFQALKSPSRIIGVLKILRIFESSLGVKF